MESVPGPQSRSDAFSRKKITSGEDFRYALPSVLSADRGGD